MKALLLSVLFFLPLVSMAQSVADDSLIEGWRAVQLDVPQEVESGLLLRRLTYTLHGRLPTCQEVEVFADDLRPDRVARVVDELLADDRFAERLTGRFCDKLRVKSEFPVNLWPNAVYAYQRFLREQLAPMRSPRNFVRSYRDFVTMLLTAQGSNFRQSAVNFYRAVPQRTPEATLAWVTSAWLSQPPSALSKKQRSAWLNTLRGVNYKATHEWKEEIVYFDNTHPLVTGTLEGLAQEVTAHPDFARATVNMVWTWTMGRGFSQNADDLSTSILQEGALDALAQGFVKANYDLHWLFREVVLSKAFRSKPGVLDDQVVGADDPVALLAKREAYFAAFTPRRMDAEVIDAIFTQLSGIPTRYSSVIPEPFTFLPDEQNTLNIADGSITNQFLILFGRPARDTGLWAERDNEVTGKQRLYLFNSSTLDRKLWRILKHAPFKRTNWRQKIDILFLIFYSRKTTQQEWEMINKQLSGSKLHLRDLAWALINTREFITCH